jgi:hypothetical protein
MSAIAETTPAPPLVKELDFDASGRERFAFEPVDFVATAFSDREGKDRLLRWGLEKGLRLQRFRFSGVYGSGKTDANAPALLADLFATAAPLRASLAAAGATPPPADALTLGAVAAERMAATAVSLDLLAPLYEGPLTEAGYIRKCIDEDFDGILVQDELRRAMLTPDGEGSSEHACALPAATRAELLFQLFRLLVVGGAMAQPDEYVAAYTASTKQLYKELVSVYRAAASGKVTVATHAFEVTGLGAGGARALFPQTSSHNRCYVMIEPLKKTATVLYLPFAPFW